MYWPSFTQTEASVPSTPEQIISLILQKAPTADISALSVKLTGKPMCRDSVYRLRKKYNCVLTVGGFRRETSAVEVTALEQYNALFKHVNRLWRPTA